ncbi:MAG: hypothetical protein R2851_06745 [Caldilineaceae bacterium]
MTKYAGRQRRQKALTRYEVLGTRDGQQLVRCWPVTGRTHQLRSSAAPGTPIIGDRLYAGETNLRQRLMLHAHRLTLAGAGRDGHKASSARPSRRV